MSSRPPYFAYGSNMDPAQMTARCPSAGFHSVALLADHRLAFSRASRQRGCGVADVLPANGCQVWGVVYSIAEDHDLAALDEAEGYEPKRGSGISFRLGQAYVHPAGDPGTWLAVFLYLAEKQTDPPPPSADYLAHLLRGAEHWGLPQAYRQQLMNIPTLAPGQNGWER